MADTLDIRQAIRQSVQEPPDARKEPSGDFWSFPTQRGWSLSAWGTRQRERELRAYYRHEYNWLGQGAFAGLTKKWSATQWEISGKKRVRYFQDVLRQAQFGEGWDVFLQRVGLDFLRQDGGAYIELIASGNPLKAPTGPVTAISHLDSLRCYPTGDPEYPVIYYSRKGKMHLMHHSRVVHLVDAPDGDESHPGYGMSAQSRAMAIVAQQIYMMRYNEMKLDDKPPPGYVVASGMTEGQRNKAHAAYQAEQSTDEKPPWGNAWWFFSLDPTQPIKLDFVTFAQAPEGYSFKEYTELHVNAWALALGVDVQELWQLTGGSLGSGAQSQILHAKSQGKTYGAFLTRLERAMNDVLPESLTFEFKVRDPYEAQERAQTAQLWAGFTTSVGGAATDDEKRILLANQVEAFKDAVTDENGEIQRLNDLDVQPESEQQTVDDATPQDEDAESPAPEQVAESEKEYSSTRASFQADVLRLIEAARADEATRRQFAASLRATARRSGLRAIDDAFVAAGVEQESLSDDMLTLFRAWELETSGYITSFGTELFQQGGISDAEVPLRVEMWSNKSLDDIFYTALREAAPAKKATWKTNPLKEHCETCVSRNGQTKALRDWGKVGFPKDRRLDCGGWLCGCSLVDKDGNRIGAS